MTEGYQKDFPECPEYVLDVPQGTAVIFSKKVKRFLRQAYCVRLGDWLLIPLQNSLICRRPFINVDNFPETLRSHITHR